jgi:hypothetical protein
VGEWLASATSSRLAQAYDELDRSCEGLTVRESTLGEFHE